VLALAALSAAGASLWGSGRGSPHAAPRTTSARHATPAAPQLHPPGPIPGYLLIATGQQPDAARQQLEAHLLAVPEARCDACDAFSVRRRHVLRAAAEPHHLEPGRAAHDPDRLVPARPRALALRTRRRQGSGAGYLNTPDDAYLLPSGLVTVADAYNCRVLFINPAHRIVKQYGATRACRHDPPRALGPINGATPLPDGGTLVSEIAGSWVDDFDAEGRLRWAVHAPVSYPSDPQLLGADRILIADYARPGHAVIMDRRGRVLWKYGPPSGAGELDHPSLATRIAPDLIAVNDDYRHRVVLISVRTKRIVWQYGHTDRPAAHRGTSTPPTASTC